MATCAKRLSGTATNVDRLGFGQFADRSTRREVYNMNRVCLSTGHVPIFSEFQPQSESHFRAQTVPLHYAIWKIEKGMTSDRNVEWRNRNNGLLVLSESIAHVQICLNSYHDTCTDWQE